MPMSSWWNAIFWWNLTVSWWHHVIYLNLWLQKMLNSPLLAIKHHITSTFLFSKSLAFYTLTGLDAPGSTTLLGKFHHFLRSKLAKTRPRPQEAKAVAPGMVRRQPRGAKALGEDMFWGRNEWNLCRISPKILIFWAIFPRGFSVCSRKKGCKKGRIWSGFHDLHVKNMDFTNTKRSTPLDSIMKHGSTMGSEAE